MLVPAKRGRENRNNKGEKKGGEWRKKWRGRGGWWMSLVVTLLLMAARRRRCWRLPLPLLPSCCWWPEKKGEEGEGKKRKRRKGRRMKGLCFLLNYSLLIIPPLKLWIDYYIYFFKKIISTVS